MRLDKFLCDTAGVTRTEAKNAVKKGQIAVNGQVQKAADFKVKENTDTVTFQGKPLSYAAFHYYMLHKPAGVVTAVRDHHDQTVLDLLVDAPGKDLSPVGRLDKDTEGLLLITDDGALSHALMSPNRHVEKEYEAVVDGVLAADAVLRFEQGMTLRDGTVCLPAKLEPLGPGESRITVCEGKYHQVRRMMASRGMTVIYLERIREGALTLEGLPRGRTRVLTEQELASLGLSETDR